MEHFEDIFEGRGCVLLGFCNFYLLVGFLFLIEINF